MLPLCAGPGCVHTKRSRALLAYRHHGRVTDKSSGLIPCGLSGSESGGPGCSGISGSKSGFTFGVSGRSSGGGVGDSGARVGALSGGVGFRMGCTGSGVLPGGWLGLRRTVLPTKYWCNKVNPSNRDARGTLRRDRSIAVSTGCHSPGPSSVASTTAIR
jgi:hypothetical protein